MDYWKDQSQSDTELLRSLLPIWLGNSGGRESLQVNSSRKAYQIFGWLAKYSTHGIVRLYVQLLTAKLNIGRGADSSYVISVVEDADSFLSYHHASDWYFLKFTDRQNVLSWATALENYNNGLTGPGLCVE